MGIVKIIFCLMSLPLLANASSLGKGADLESWLLVQKKFSDTHIALMHQFAYQDFDLW